jgi:hypothetical protein
MNCTRESALGYGPYVPLVGAGSRQSPAAFAVRSVRWRSSSDRPPRNGHRGRERIP